MGNSNSSEHTSATSVVSESLTNAMMTVSNSKVVKISASQLMDLSCTPSDALQAVYLKAYEACLANPKRSAKDCEMAKYACVFEELSQDSTVEYQGMSNIDAALVTQVQDKMTADLENKVQSEKDSISEWAKSALGVASNSSDKSSVSQAIRHHVENVIDIKLINAVDAAFVRNQTISIQSTGGVSAKRLTQKSASKLVENLLSESASMAKTISELDAKAKATTDIKSKGLVDAFQSLVDAVGGAFSMGMIMLGIVVLVGLVGAAYFMTSDNGKVAIQAYAAKAK